MFQKVLQYGYIKELLNLLTKAANDDIVDWISNNLENEANGAEDKESDSGSRSRVLQCLSRWKGATLKDFDARFDEVCSWSSNNINGLH